MMVGDNDSAGVTVRVSDLLSKIKYNRDAHRETFLDAQKGYREDVIRELDTMLQDARSGRTIRRNVHLVEPKDHTKDYNRVIAMLEMCTKEEVFVTEGEFQQYVQDDWGWKDQFIASTSNYTNRR